jgi:hypothetical protein
VEVYSPTVPAGIEQTDYPPRYGIHARDVRPLVSIAVKTGEGKILQVRLAAMLPGNDMIDLERRAVKGLRYLVVFTPASSAPPDLFLDGLIHTNV